MSNKKILGIVAGENIIGKTYGYLVVLKEIENYIPLKKRVPSAKTPRIVLCKCICGNEHPVRVIALKSGNTTSCGCKKKEHHLLRHTIHGKSKTTEYSIWNSMHRRCKDKKHESYKLYGGRGIKVCKRWEKFENFLEDMGERPGKQFSLDRWPNKNGDYKPNNCRWATIFQQNNNTRSNVYIKYQGVSITMMELSIKIGMKYDTLKNRIYLGWTLKKILKVPVRKRTKKIRNE